MDALLSMIAIVCLVVGGLSFYMLPTIIAYNRHHSSIWDILVANIVFGWVIIFWPIILIWALSGRHEPERRSSASA